MTITQEKSNEQIYVCSWGLTMTIVDFYGVIKETEKQIVLRKLESKCVEDCGFYAGKVVPTNEPYEYMGEPEDVRCVKKDGGVYDRKSGFYKSYKKWDGKPVYFNKCD